MAYIGREPQIGNYQICDAISVVNGQAAYTMQVSSVNVIPESVNHMIVSLNGVIQKPGSSYTISSSTITFSSNLATGDSIDFIYLLGNTLDLGTPSDDTVTGAKIVDNAINSEHYTDGSIDTAHIADGQVTTAKLSTAVFTGATDIGAAIADADLFLMDDGAGGTIRKTTAARLKTYAGFDPDAAVVFNESSADVDFRVESNGNTHMLFVDGGNNRVGINTAPDLGVGLHIRSADSGASVDGNADELVVEGSGSSGISILSGNSSSGNLTFGDDGDANVGRLEYNHGDNSIRLDAAGSQVLMVTSASRVGTGSSSGTLTLEGGATYPGGEIALAGGLASSNPGTIIFSTDDGSDTDPAERMRIASNGDCYIGATSGSIGNTSPGVKMFNTTDSTNKSGMNIVTAGANIPISINRSNSDGKLISFYQAGTEEGNIDVSGSTITYGGFTGTHWSRFTDNSKPTILKGTVLETLDEMCDWYQLHFTDSNGNVEKIPHVLTDTQSVGDVITYLYDTGLKTPPTEDEEGNIIPGGEAITENVQATIVKENDIKHMKSKVSDTVDAKNVYGVFSAWDEDGEGYNDFYVASVGSYVVRIKQGETIAKGDLLQSNGDGTAKVQTDDAVRSSSFAKVLSTTKIETYDDGSFIVPCSLMC